MYDKLKLWFFRDLTDYQRRQLFSVFGMPVDEIGYSHGKQEHALRHVARSLTVTKPDTAPAPRVRGYLHRLVDTEEWNISLPSQMESAWAHQKLWPSKIEIVPLVASAASEGQSDG